MDKYYQLDFEDVIGDDIATRFKYAKVKPVNFGLTPAEILLADETMLGDFVSIKKMAAYRPEWKLDEDEVKHSSKKRVKYIQRKTAALREEWESGLAAKPSKVKKNKNKNKHGDTAEAADKKSKKSKGKKNKHDDEGDAPAESEATDKKLNRRQRKKAKKDALETSA
ncbi:Ribosome biogenesis protein Kri1 [Coemansia erecta]|nr:Ribosome biogenesis protein Kri1 [Coemansia erecta]